MKVNIKITGTVMVVEYSSKQYEDFYENYYVTVGWNTVNSVTANDNDITKKKGKYFKTKEYFHNLFRPDGDHPLPVEIHARVFDNYEDELIYEIELEDNEEFDPKKVQLIKSDYEFDGMPYFILTEYILYDGKEIYTNVDDYCINGKSCNEFVVEELYD